MASSSSSKRSQGPGSNPSKAESSLKRKALSLTIFLVVAASILNALFGDRGLTELLKVRQELEQLDWEIAELRARNQQLLDEVRSLKASPLAIERLARENLGLVRPGEIVLLIQGGHEGEENPPSSAQEDYLPQK
jgi:cell division protein FtsB